MEALEEKLGSINLQIPAADDTQPPHLKESTSETYKSQSKKEKSLIAYAENFQRQFRQLYGDRKPLFLKPPNEYGVEKFICTTLRPTQLPFKELYEFDGCAYFVADYLSYKALEINNDLPDKQVSPTSVLSSQKGNCFDYSILLSSLLIGVGYDAYCVCGYATKEVTQLNQSRKPCPQLVTNVDEAPVDTSNQNAKYSVRPPKDLESQFLKKQEQRARDRIAEEERLRKEEEAAKIAEQEKPSPDNLFGLRYHCWVLVLAGKREVAQSFFIEPTTGETLPLDTDQYLGVETMWNHKNYWVNMQDCSEGVKTLVYDLGDASKWEYFFPNVDKHLLLPDEENKLGEDEDKDKEEEPSEKEHFQLPPSWVDPITISPKDYETRCPKGKKTTLYYKSKVEKYSPYLNADGLVEKVVSYEDTDRTKKLKIHETFFKRKDFLDHRITDARTGQINDSFRPGRQKNLKEHEYYGAKSLKPDYRTMNFYSDLRVDGLVKRDITPTEMTEYYEKRQDHLYYRLVTYGKPVKRFEPADKEKGRHIQKIIEKYHRNPSLSPNEDIATCSFLLDERKIQLVYHLEENRITPSTRDFYLPVLSGEQAQQLTFNPDMTTAYQVDPYMKDPKQRVLYDMLERLLKAQEESIATVRLSEQETESILSARLQEELNTVLTISVYDVVRNETARKHRQELERKQIEEERIQQEKEKDYLAPFLARHGDPPILSKEQKTKVSEECLSDLRKRLVDVANIIQSHFERETEELQKKQVWYKQKQTTMTKEEEVEYVSFCNEAMYRIHILEQRLNRHKMTAPQKYQELEQKLKTDPRLVIS